MPTKLRTDDGRELNSNVSLRPGDIGFELIFESSGESGKRNPDYKEAFELAIRRLAALDAQLLDARVESRNTAKLPVDERRIKVPNLSYPVALKTVVSVGDFARKLRSAGKDVAKAGERGGNPTKRIALDFVLPASISDAHTLLQTKLIGPARRAPSTEAMTVDDSLSLWWGSMPEERYWLEITGRADLGTDLRAPLTNEQGDRFWSYSLLACVDKGDVVFHYDRHRSAIVAVSVATGTKWCDSIVWAARGTSAREAGIEPHVRDGLYVGLENFSALAHPLALTRMREMKGEIESGVAALRSRVGNTLYFPLELGSARETRPMQGYLFKLPRFFVDLFPQLVAPPPEHLSRDTKAPVVPGDYRRANDQTSVATADPFLIDPAEKERALNGHAKTQNALADYLISLGIRPLSAVGSQPPFDIAWDCDGYLWVGEVKSITDANEEKQLRLGLGQVLRYRHIVGMSRPARAALIVERMPRDPTWLELCAHLNVIVVWPNAWDRLGLSARALATNSLSVAPA